MRNFVYSVLGIDIGMFIHPNFPNNFISFHLNAILVPWNTMFGNIKLNYGLEWNPIDTKTALIDFFILFAGLFLLLVILLTKRPKTGFYTVSFFFATALFLCLSMFSNCYWYFAYPVGLIFLSMFFSDYFKDKSTFIRASFIFLFGILIITRAFLIKKQDPSLGQFTGHIVRNQHYELMGNWMNKHIPPKEIIFHTSWSDSPYFICLNPKDYYLVVLDPIYMYYYDPNIYTVYNALGNGQCTRPCKTLKKIFKSRYGYTGKGYGLYNQIKDNKHFKILFEDDFGAIFKMIEKKSLKQG